MTALTPKEALLAPPMGSEGAELAAYRNIHARISGPHFVRADGEARVGRIAMLTGRFGPRRMSAIFASAPATPQFESGLSPPEMPRSTRSLTPIRATGGENDGIAKIVVPSRGATLCCSRPLRIVDPGARERKADLESALAEGRGIGQLAARRMDPIHPELLELAWVSSGCRSKKHSSCTASRRGGWGRWGLRGGPGHDPAMAMAAAPMCRDVRFIEYGLCGFAFLRTYGASGRRLSLPATHSLFDAILSPAKAQTDQDQKSRRKRLQTRLFAAGPRHLSTLAPGPARVAFAIVWGGCRGAAVVTRR